MDFCVWGYSVSLRRLCRPAWHFITFCLIVAFWLVLNTAGAATSRNYTEFQYDESGNLIGIVTEQSSQPPQINSFKPSTIRIGVVAKISVVGSGLRAATIATGSPAIVVENVVSSDTSLSFDILAGSATVLGQHQLSFTTPLGLATSVIDVIPAPPKLLVSPSPLTLTVGENVSLDIQLSHPDIIDQIINVSVVNSAVASVSPSIITIPAGSTQASSTIDVQAISLGNTGLLLSVSDLPDRSVLITVTESFTPVTGNNTFLSAPVGVIVEQAPPPSTGPDSTLYASSVGVLLELPPSASPTIDTSLVSPSLGVQLELPPSTTPTIDTSLVSPLLGVQLELPPSTTPTIDTSLVSPLLGVQFGTQTPTQSDINRDVYATNLGLALGIHARRIQPEVLEANTASTLLVDGAYLQDVTSISFEPAEGITVSGPLVVNVDGTQLSVPISVSIDATSSYRRLILHTVSGRVLFSDPHADQIRINSTTPLVLPP